MEEETDESWCFRIKYVIFLVVVSFLLCLSSNPAADSYWGTSIKTIDLTSPAPLPLWGSSPPSSSSSFLSPSRRNPTTESVLRRIDVLWIGSPVCAAARLFGLPRLSTEAPPHDRYITTWINKNTLLTSHSVHSSSRFVYTLVSSFKLWDKWNYFYFSIHDFVIRNVKFCFLCLSEQWKDPLAYSLTHSQIQKQPEELLQIHYSLGLLRDLYTVWISLTLWALRVFFLILCKKFRYWKVNFHLLLFWHSCNKLEHISRVPSSSSDCFPQSTMSQWPRRDLFNSGAELKYLMWSRHVMKKSCSLM